MAKELLPCSIGINDNFFVCGGNSLFAVRFFNMITECNHFKESYLEINQIFKYATIKELALFLDGSNELNSIELSGFAKECIVPLQTEGKLPPLFIVHPAGGLVFPYFQLAGKFAGHQPLYAIQDPRIDTDDPLNPEETIEGIASDYISAIKIVQPTGPYYLSYEIIKKFFNESKS